VLEEYLPFVIIGVVTAGLIAATVVLSRLAWRRQLRRYLMDLAGRRDVIGTGLSSARAVAGTLVELDTDGLVAFAQNASDERTALAEIAARMRMEASELEALALPKRLWPPADALGQAATTLAAQAGAVGEATGVDAIDGLAGLDLEAVQAFISQADEEIRSASEACGLTESTMYSGTANT